MDDLLGQNQVKEKIIYRTRKGVFVEIRKRKIEDGKEKVAAYRVPTGGFHGWLHLDKLVPWK